MERDMIISRQKSSIERLREKNQNWGKGKLLSQERRDEILQLKEEGYSYRSICKKLGVSLGSVQYTIKNTPT